MSARGPYTRQIVGILDPRPDWMDVGICSSTLTNEQRSWFFPNDRVEAQQARQICFSCPVQPECLDYALRNDEDHGIWGGSSPDERRSILMHRQSHAAAI